MNRTIPVSVIALCGTFVSAALSGQSLPEARAVIDQLDDLYRSSSSHAFMTMTVVNERGTRELSLESWSRGDDEALIVIRTPSREAGTATLRTEERLWNYAPRADRMIRIPAGLLSDNWMGSHFTNDDLLRESSYLDDHQASLSWENNGRRLLRIDLTPVPELPVVYTRLSFWLEAGTWTPARAEYYDEDNLIRTLIFDDVQVVNGRRIPMRMMLQPADAPDERTVMHYTELELDIAVDGSLFSRRGLRRVARN